MDARVGFNRGFSGIVNLLVLMTLSFVLATLLLPSRDDGIRAHISQGLRQAESAKAALARTCQSGAAKLVSNNADASYFFVESKYVANIQLSADCASGTMSIRVRTQNTGARPDPEILLISDTARDEGGQDGPGPDKRQSGWRCGLASGNAEYAPSECRERLSLG